MYGVLGTQQHYSRIDHCQFGGGRMQAINFLGIGDRDDALQRTCSASSDYAWANGATPIQGGGGTKRYRTCYVIPPAGATNFLGETQSEAIAACQNRCDFFGSGCVGVNVVPQIAPTAVFFQNESRNTGSQAFDAFGGERAVPYGHGNCNETCFAREPNPAQNFICYPIKLGITRVVEGERGCPCPRLTLFYSHPHSILSVPPSLSHLPSPLPSQRTGLWRSMTRTMRFGTARATRKM